MTLFEIYTKKEADDKGIAYKEDWRNASEGEWICTEDGYVAPVMKTRSMTSGAIEYVYPFGRAFHNQKMGLEFLPHKKNRSYHHVTGRHECEYESRKFRTRRAVSAYVSMLLAGKIDYEVLSNIYRPGTDEKRMKIMLTNRAVKKMIEAELKEVLNKHGITKDYAVEKLKKAMEIAEAKEDAKTMMTGVDKALELMGEKGGKRTVTQSIEGYFPSGLIDKAEDRIKLERKIEYEGNFSREEEQVISGAEPLVEGESAVAGED